jgi:hypothetical protein
MSEYIELENIDLVLKNIALKIVTNENLCKLLKFNDSSALSKEITEDERYALNIQDGDTTNTRIFYQPFNNDTITDERAELRIYFANFKPENMYIANANIGFDIVVHNNMWRLDEGKQRPLNIFKEVLKSLNGQDVKSLGELNFLNSYCTLMIFNKSFTGYSFSMSTKTR